jgi:CRISPR-associated RAMP protein (TIGR02581 family)
MINSDEIRKRGKTRYILHGQMITDTGLHVGSGYGSPRTNATVVRDMEQRPYIPGSSFKGALRSTVERLIAGLPGSKVTSCQLAEDYADCLTTDKTRQQKYQDLQEHFARKEKTEQDLIDFLKDGDGLCDTCRLFGSPFSQSRLLVRDLTLTSNEGKVAGEIRHGVGIDRETLTAREKIKFDFEALPSQLQFEAELIVERPSPLDLALLALGLREMELGFVPLGGIRSRGLGRCHLASLEVRELDLTNKTAVLSFLRQSRPASQEQARQLAGQPKDASEFIEQHLTELEQMV